MSTAGPLSEAPEARTFGDLLADCVHCGFCLPACPTYRSWGDEMDSPRGRIDLMLGLHEGAIELNDTVVGHFDACLGCMGCLTACPSGVQYDLLIESTRAKIEREHPRNLFDRAFRELIFALFPRPDRLKKMAPWMYALQRSGLHALARRAGLVELFGKRIAQLDKLMPPVYLRRMRAELPPFTPARRAKRGSVALIAGCVQRVFFPNVNAASARVLAAEGYDVIVPAEQGCCGALSLHAGREPEALAYARGLLDRFVPAEGALPYDAVIINAAGCGSTLKQYGVLLENDPAYAERAGRFAALVKDVNEFLAGVEALAPRRPAPIRVAYHDACHLRHAQRIREAPRALLRSIPQLEVAEVPNGDECCGSAGVYNLLEPDSAREIGLRKVENVLSTGARLLASANPGCTLQIGSLLAERGIDLPAAHPIEILDAVVR